MDSKQNAHFKQFPYDNIKFHYSSSEKNPTMTKNLVIHAKEIPENQSESSCSSDSDGSSSGNEDSFLHDFNNLIPPPNPLPPAALAYHKEPIRLGINAPLLYFH